jgi:hypothetical protein
LDIFFSFISSFPSQGGRKKKKLSGCQIQILPTQPTRLLAASPTVKGVPFASKVGIELISGFCGPHPG